jgi:single-strand selective monofunctional uracil DNA glycosylase
MNKTARKLLDNALDLRDAMERLTFKKPVAYVYNPLMYAWEGHRQYIEKFVDGPRDILLVGMNPGPWGMAQTGVPFGEVNLVKTWMGIDAKIGRPKREHPARPVLGFDCKRSEVSGTRMWGTISKKFPAAKDFFAHHYVIGFCPLLFLEESGRNLTPDKIAKHDRAPLEKACAEHLGVLIDVLKPKTIVAIGGYAAKRIATVSDLPIVTMPHPSPASPQANRDWAGLARKALVDGGVKPFL